LMIIREPLVNYRLSPNGAMSAKFELVAQGSYATQSKLLLRLGISADLINQRLLRLARYPQRTTSSDLDILFLNSYRNFLSTVFEKNCQSSIYARKPMLEAAEWMWECTVAESARLGGIWLSTESVCLYLSRSFPAVAHRRFRTLFYLIRSAVRRL